MDPTLVDRASTAAIVLIEFYRVFMGSLLVLFVPAACGDHPCNPYENIVRGNTLYFLSASLNLITLVSFALLYGIELKRENRLTRYLRVDHQIATDTETVGKAIKTLTLSRQQNIVNIDILYQRIARTTFILYIINTALSAYIIVSFYMDNKTPISLVTNTILIGGKFYDVYLITNTDANVFLSAYRKQKVQFNAVNPDKIEAPPPVLAITST